MLDPPTAVLVPRLVEISSTLEDSDDSYSGPHRWHCLLSLALSLPASNDNPALHASNCKFAGLNSDTALDASLVEPLTGGQVDDVAGTRLAAFPYAPNLGLSFRGRHSGVIILGFGKFKTSPPPPKKRKTRQLADRTSQRTQLPRGNYLRFSYAIAMAPPTLGVGGSLRRTFGRRSPPLNPSISR
ncbi:hypothetical protein LX32DRAFT_369557 [Colletotrichum zoysiae]|uniref:Uncharacterized protein n=1 Tax=Colletotrichum zoysiae TaxID=1216348 RepID=A0AAD9HUJ2_9PEZI|nr:hypothetical protein LX32DRAFT_369557 [Colletotrichum zoysiae]